LEDSGRNVILASGGKGGGEHTEIEENCPRWIYDSSKTLQAPEYDIGSSFQQVATFGRWKEDNAISDVDEGYEELTNG
jgi:hypothetical protein